MSLKTYGKEELKDMSMIELANIILNDEKKALNFKEIFEKVAEMKGFTEAQKQNLIAQFYTDLNVDGRFITPGANMWGLKRWYPVDQIDEQITNESKRKKKKKKKKAVVEENIDLDDEGLDIVAVDIEEIDGFDDDEEDEDGFDDLEDEDFDEFEEEDEEEDEDED